jgi:archaellum component FlaF (FlaF/FlaG flagellin family)
MGLSLAASTAILFSAFVIAFSALFGAVSEFQSEIGTAQTGLANQNLDASMTAMTWEGIDAINSTIMVRNTGTSTIDLRGLDILVNGTLVNEKALWKDVDGNNDTQLAFPQELISIHMDLSLVEASAKIVARNGYSVAGRD